MRTLFRWRTAALATFALAAVSAVALAQTTPAQKPAMIKAIQRTSQT